MARRFKGQGISREGYSVISTVMKRATTKKLSELEELLALHYRVSGISGYQREYQFHRERRWRFDFAFPSVQVALECEGGIWTGGAHTRGKHFESDCEKYSEAALAGWMVGRFTLRQIQNMDALEWTKRALKERGYKFNPA